jgi:parafibromin
MWNVVPFLIEGKYIPVADARAALGAEAVKPSRHVITRTDSKGFVAKYYVVDNTSSFQASADWLKVAAVLAAGQEWQFKGWKWGKKPDDSGPDSTPVEIFSRTVGFHCMFEGDAVPETISKWAVTLLPVAKSQQRRYLDAGVVAKFWNNVDNFIYSKKPYLVPKAASAS